jgi:N-acetyl-anhydromuramyl-L-alanine amidase AmpD
VPPSDAQIKTTAKLVKSLCNIYDIPIGKIRAHHDFAHYKSCPGNKFPFKTFLSAVENI